MLALIWTPLADWGSLWLEVGYGNYLVVFGEDDAPSLLGAYTLEGLALAVDPVDQRLIPRGLLP